jgi:hypothetical protein
MLHLVSLSLQLQVGKIKFSFALLYGLHRSYKFLSSFIFIVTVRVMFYRLSYLIFLKLLYNCIIFVLLLNKVQT